ARRAEAVVEAPHRPARRTAASRSRMLGGRRPGRCVHRAPLRDPPRSLAPGRHPASPARRVAAPRRRARREVAATSPGIAGLVRQTPPAIAPAEPPWLVVVRLLARRSTPPRRRPW